MLHWATRFFVYVYNFLSKRKCACDREWWQNTLQKSHMPKKKKKMPQLSLMHKVLVHRSYITWKLKIPNCSWASARNVSFGFCIQCPLAWHLPSRKYSPDGGIAAFYEFLLCLDYFTWLDLHFTFNCLIVSIKLSGVTARA